MRQRRPTRVETFDYLGRYRYFLTMCTDRRRSLFGDAGLVHITRGQILQTADETSFALLAYIFMPDHLHLLAQGMAEAADFRRFVTVLRRRTTTSCPRVIRPLWQDGYHDRVLRNADDVSGVISYIMMNPVRAGLVERPSEYPFSWSLHSS